MHARRWAVVFLLASGTVFVQAIPSLNAPPEELWRRASEHYRGGRAIEKKDAAAARKEYLAALAIEPRFADAAYALAGLGRATEADGYREARRLVALGLRTEALAAMKKAAQSSDVPPNLLYLSGGGIDSWRTAKDWMMDYGVPIAQIGGVLVLLWLLGRYFLGKPTVEIADFSDANITPAVGRNVTAMFREHLKRFATTYQPKLGRFSGPAQPFALPTQFATAIPASLGWLGGLPSLLLLLSPRRKVTVSGFLHPPSTHGAGLTLLLTQSNRILYTSTLWQRDFDPLYNPAITGVNAYYGLAEPAAVWLAFRLSLVIPS